MTDDVKQDTSAETPAPLNDNTPQKPTLRQRCRNAFQSVSTRDIVGVVKHTAKDLRSKKEIGMLVTASIVPGGFVTYALYRAAKYRKTKAGNDNTPALLPAPEAPAADKAAKPAKKFRNLFKGPKA